MGVGLKICGITRAEDLAACIELGVDAIGLNLWPRSKRYIAPGPMLSLLEGAPERGAPTRVAVFVDTPPRELERSGLLPALDMLQPHGEGRPEPYAELAGRHGLGWVWVVRGTPDLATLRVPAPSPQWILLDAAVAEFGGVGQRTDWNWAAQAVAALAPIPVWLAGGIRPDNVALALSTVAPAGLDVASGSELGGATRGQKDRAAIAELVRACRAPTGP